MNDPMLLMNKEKVEALQYIVTNYDKVNKSIQWSGFKVIEWSSFKAPWYIKLFRKIKSAIRL